MRRVDSPCAIQKLFPVLILEFQIMTKKAPDRSVVSDPDNRAEHSEPIEESAIAARAYEIWHERGCPIGSDQQDWFRAEQELKDRTNEQTSAAA